MALKNLGNSIANLAGEIGKTAVSASQKAVSNIANSAENIDFKKVGEVKDSAVKGTQQIKEKAASKVKEGANKSTELVNKVMDVNGDEMCIRDRKISAKEYFAMKNYLRIKLKEYVEI